MHIDPKEFVAEAIDTMERVIKFKKPFDIDSWVSDECHPYDCGTSACIIGWMARERKFNWKFHYKEGRPIFVLDENDRVVNTARSLYDNFYSGCAYFIPDLTWDIIRLVMGETKRETAEEVLNELHRIARKYEVPLKQKTKDVATIQWG